MKFFESSSRRRFLASGLVWPGAAVLRPSVCGAATQPVLHRPEIEAEVRRRARQYALQRYLVVDYYRIRRRLAYPLPVEGLSIPSVPVPTIPDYPWSIWMLWALEERVNALGWAAEWFQDTQCARQAARDLEALAEWPQYCQLHQPDLASAHAGRLFWTASRYWHWIDDSLRRKMAAACARHVEELSPLVQAYYGPIGSQQDLLARPEPYRKLANIPLIGTLGAALTATASANPAAPLLHRKAHAIVGAILELRGHGFSEGVGYDGYVLDFVGDWLQAAPADLRRQLLQHPRLKDYLDESYLLAAPGALEQVAALSDVEPQEMPFHYSAQVKLAHFGRDPVRDWYLPRWRLDWIRSNALGLLRPVIDTLNGAPPPARAANAHYAVALRTGWEKEDLAVVMSCSNSPMSHIQDDSGTLVIGTRGRWLICDPGYQQYMKDSERDFTIGPAAHNYPVINGAAQNRKQPRLLQLGRAEPDVLHAKVDLSGCYPGEAGIRSVVRSVWEVESAGVVVADQIEADSAKTLTYHWHGHPDAAWWCREGWLLLHLPECDLWFTSPQTQLSQRNIQRLPGSRGQLTLAAPVDPAPGVIWWLFGLAKTPPPVETFADGKIIRFLGKRFQIS